MVKKLRFRSYALVLVTLSLTLFGRLEPLSANAETVYQPRQIFGLGPVTSVAYSPAGDRVVMASAYYAQVFDAQTGMRVLVLAGHTDLVQAVAWSPDGHYLLTGSLDNTARLWDAHTGKEIRVFSGHTDGVLTVAFSSDGVQAQTGSKDKTVRIWDVATGREEHALPTSAHLTLAFSADGRKALCASNTTIEQWDLATNKINTQLVIPKINASTVAFSPDRTRAVTAGWDASINGNVTVKIWDLATTTILRTFTRPQSTYSLIFSSSFSPDGTRVLVGGDHFTWLYDANDGRLLQTYYFLDNGGQAVAFSPDGGKVLTGGQHVTALWETDTGNRLQLFSPHTREITAVAFTPDGQGVLSGAADQTARLWDTATGQPVRTIAGYQQYIQAVAISPDNHQALTAGNDYTDCTIKLWDLDRSLQLRTFTGHQQTINAVTFSLDGSKVLSGSDDRTARLWDAATGTELCVFAGHADRVSSVAFSPDGSKVLTGSDDHTARLWNAATGELLQILTGHTERLFAVAFTPDGTSVLTGSSDQTIRLWEAATGKLVWTQDVCGKDINAVAFAADGRTAVIGSTYYLEVFDLVIGAAIQVIHRYQISPYHLAISPDGQTFLASVGRPEPDGYSFFPILELYDVATGTLRQQWDGGALAFSPDGTRVITGWRGSTDFNGVNAYLRSVDNGTLLATLSGPSRAIKAVSVTADGKTVLTGTQDPSARLWQTETGREMGVFMLPATGYSIPTGAWAITTAGDKVVGSYDGDKIHLFDTATGNELRALVGYTGSIYAVAFSSDGSMILSGSFDRTARLWETGTGRKIRSFACHSIVNAVALSANAKLAVTGLADATAVLWDLATGDKLRVYSGHTAELKTVAISPNGRWILTGSKDNTARLWNATTGAEVRRFVGHGGQGCANPGVWAVAFTPDGRHVLTGGGDATMMLWDIDIEPKAQVAPDLWTIME